MKTTFNKDTYKFEWNLTTWYQKTIYVFGFAYTVILAIAFVVGMIAGILE